MGKQQDGGCENKEQGSRSIMQGKDKGEGEVQSGGDEEEAKKKNAYNTVCSRAVTHHGTNTARPRLTSVIGREPVHSRWYDRKRCSCIHPTLIYHHHIQTCGHAPLIPLPSTKLPNLPSILLKISVRCHHTATSHRQQSYKTKAGEHRIKRTQHASRVCT